MDFGVTKELRQYTNKQKILLVGEGDFSFALYLAKAFGSATNITATSLDSRDEVSRKYGIVNVEELERYGCTVFHGVNVHSMASDYRLDRYDRIVFNFPHSGEGFGHSEHKEYFITSNQELVRGFFFNAKQMLKDEDGEIHVTHKTAYPFDKWEIETRAEENGLRLVTKVEFNLYAFPGYSNKRGAGINPHSTFRIGAASTFMFKIYTISFSFYNQRTVN